MSNWSGRDNASIIGRLADPWFPHRPFSGALAVAREMVKEMVKKSLREGQPVHQECEAVTHAVDHDQIRQVVTIRVSDLDSRGSAAHSNRCPVFERARMRAEQETHSAAGFGIAAAIR